jgi:hypothetical protein
MRTIIHWSALVGSAALAFACSSSGSALNGGGGGGGGDSDSGDTASSSSSGGTGSASSGFYQVFDAGLNDMPDSGGVGPVTGSMSFALTQDQTVGVGEGSGTDMAAGTFAASLAGIVQADANLQGTLNCSQGSFTGNLINGVYGFGNGTGDAGPVSGGGASNTFMGPLQSSYDGTTAAFVNGRWSMTIPTLGECIGSWSATYSGPLPGSSGGSSSGGSSGIVDAGGQ